MAVAAAGGDARDGAVGRLATVWLPTQPAPPAVLRTPTSCLVRCPLLQAAACWCSWRTRRWMWGRASASTAPPASPTPASRPSFQARILLSASRFLFSMWAACCMSGRGRAAQLPPHSRRLTAAALCPAFSRLPLPASSGLWLYTLTFTFTFASIFVLSPPSHLPWYIPHPCSQGGGHRLHGDPGGAGGPAAGQAHPAREGGAGGAAPAPGGRGAAPGGGGGGLCVCVCVCRGQQCLLASRWQPAFPCACAPFSHVLPFSPHS